MPWKQRLQRRSGKADVDPSIPDSTFAFKPPAGREGGGSVRKPRPTAIEIGSEAADFQLKDLEGREIQLKTPERECRPAEFLGDVVWAVPS
jgi:hypothetical protein